MTDLFVAFTVVPFVLALSFLALWNLFKSLIQS